jgi:hypothetical protein
MRSDNLAILDTLTLAELENSLNAHSLAKIEPDRWNRFTWSASRHQTFSECKRRYYLTYYGSRRVLEAENKIVSAVWWLKQVTGLRMWIGTVIHTMAARAVRQIRDGEGIDPGVLTDHALKYYRDGIAASERGIRHDKQWVALFEHVYPDDESTLDRDEAERSVYDLMQTLLASDAFNAIAGLPASAIKEIDEPFQSFTLGGIAGLTTLTVFAIPDVLLKQKDAITIIDWKTGDTGKEAIRWQAGVYRLYAHTQYKSPEDSIQILISDLGNHGESLDPPGGTPSLAETRTFIDRSVNQMQALLDNEYYNTAAIGVYPMTNDLTLCQRCAFKRACWRQAQD